MTETAEKPKRKKRDPEPLTLLRQPEEAQVQPDGEVIQSPAPSDDKEKLEEIIRLHKAKALAENELIVAQESLKSAKAALKAADDNLNRGIAELENPLPLFATQNADVEADDEGWRDILLEHALQGISSTLIFAIKDKGLETVGQWSDWISKDGGRNRVTDIPGVGDANAEKIAAAFDAFWVRWAAKKEKEAADERQLQENLVRTGNAGWATEEDAE